MYGGDGKRISNEDLAGLIRNELQVAMGSDQDDQTGQDAEALDYYFGRRPGKFSKLGSAMISNDVADSVDALLAQIMPTFSTDCTATFEAQGPQDDDQAQLESNTCNYMIMERNDGYKVFYSAIKDALIMKNGIIKVYVDEFERVESQELDGEPSMEQLAVAQMEAEQAGQEVYLEEYEGGYSLKTVKYVKELRVDAVDKTNFVVSTSQRDIDLNRDFKFCAEKRIETVTSLLEQGFNPDIVEGLGTFDTETEVDALARNQTDNEDENYWYEPSSRPLEVWECYIMVDQDGDGLAELRRVIYCSNQVIESEVVKWVPYACGTPYLNPHRWLGISIFDKLKDIHNQKTYFVRQYAENMARNNTRRHVYTDGVDEEALLNGETAIKAGAVNQVMELQVSDIGPSCMNILGYLDKMRSERVGASLDMQAEGLPSGDATAHGVERQMSFKEQMAGMITRTLAETLVKQTYLLCHRTLKTYFQGQTIQYKSGGQWTGTDPKTWGVRDHVSIDVGMSMGERSRQAAVLSQVVQMQKLAMESGGAGVLTGWDQIYNAVTDLVRMSGISNPEQYWIDPSSPEAQQAAQGKAQQAQQAQAQGAQLQQAMIGIESQKVVNEATKDTREFEFKVAEMLLKSEQEEAKITQDVSELDEAQDAIRNAR